MEEHLHSIGQRVIVPSSLTGALLDYFVPYPITDAAKRLPPRSGSLPANPAEEISSILPIVPLLAAARRGGTGTDPALIKLHAHIIAGTRRLNTVDDLVRLGNEIGSGNSGLRRQIVYSGGPTPSTASILFPPPSELPPLMESLSAFMAGDLSGWEPIDVATMVCEYAVRVHPFNDGNGRWARLLALEAGRRTGSLWAGACAGLRNQQSTRTEAGRRHFVEATSWESYLQAGIGFSTALRSLMYSDGSFDRANCIYRLTRNATASHSHALELALHVLEHPSLTPAVLGSRYGWSMKKSTVFVESLADLCAMTGFDGGRHRNENGLSTNTLRNIESIAIDWAE